MKKQYIKPNIQVYVLADSRNLLNIVSDYQERTKTVGDSED